MSPFKFPEQARLIFPFSTTYHAVYDEHLVKGPTASKLLLVLAELR
jgi:hypothetical protein